ncbi:MAG: UDP-N-acetylmuramoyl-L-alanyl-D-glutamate--2,6-diaminopimelate ligase [Pseudomonadota bacterium]
MNLATLLEDSSLPPVQLTGLSEHTNEVYPGDGFCAVTTDPLAAEQHCRAAVARGARALLVDAELAALSSRFADVTVITVPQLAARRGQLAARFYADPSAHLACVGVTGTNGKTSTAYHIADLLQLLGRGAGYLGTLGAGALHDLRDQDMTTPNPVALQRLLAAMVDDGLGYAALEVSSHALDQRRAADVAFDYAVFTNLSRDHLDYHGTMEAYQQAKQKLFTCWPLQTAIVNSDDPFGRHLAEICAAEVVTYGHSGDWRWQLQTDHQAGGHLTRVVWQTPHGNCSADLHVVADYAIANITAAMATVTAMGIPFAEVSAQVAGLRGVPGRMQRVPGPESGPLVVVDYAHTPDALDKVLLALSDARVQHHGTQQLICVVGCGGDRDTGKRPLMGRIAEHRADTVWLTSDNPRSEDPRTIVAAMQSGMQHASAAGIRIEIDRRAAITGALAEAGAGDIVLIAGKGHETYQEIDGQRHQFDDYQIALEQLRRVH